MEPTAKMLGRYPVLPEHVLHPARHVDDRAEQFEAAIRREVDRAADAARRSQAR